MFRLKYFICTLFLWLTFCTPSLLNGATLNIESPSEISTQSNNIHHQALLVDTDFNTNWAIGSFKTPFLHTNSKVQSPNAQTYDYKLLYLEIENTIPLKLTARTIIFPFHFFT